MRIQSHFDIKKSKIAISVKMKFGYTEGTLD